MKTYDKGAGSLGAAPTRRSLRQLFKRWIDRERELISLRNAVGMMGEARRADAAEYHAMALTLQSARERLTRLENCAPLIGKATWDVLDQRAQQKRQGYTAEHDDQHGGESLARADALQARVDAEPEGFTQGIDAAAKMLDKMADDYSRAHAIQDPDTGVYEFGRGGKEDYYNTLRELADDVRSIVYAPGERENAAQTLKAAKDAAFEQAANLVELEYAPDAKAGKRLTQIAQHIRDLKKRSS